jgi:hypothetical protein
LARSVNATVVKGYAANPLYLFFSLLEYNGYGKFLFAMKHGFPDTTKPPLFNPAFYRYEKRGPEYVSTQK